MSLPVGVSRGSLGPYHSTSVPPSARLWGDRHPAVTVWCCPGLTGQFVENIRGVRPIHQGLACQSRSMSYTLEANMVSQ